jgi:putative FmdB family regulatory protein
MPVYEYRCKSCGKTHEIEHGFHDVRPTECPSCGGELVRVFHPVGVVFKGSGFYKTDYGGSKSSPRAQASGDGSSSSGESGGESKGESKKEPAATSDAKPSDSKSSESKTDPKPSGPASAS